jgi:hypothetical protein
VNLFDQSILFWLIEPRLNGGGHLFRGRVDQVNERARQLARRSGRPQLIRPQISVRDGSIGFRFGPPAGAIMPNGRWQPPVAGLGDMLTDIACDQTTFARSWRTRFNDGMSTAAQAALLGGAAAGLLGAILKRPMFAIAGGAVTAWAAHAIWTAPLRP